MDSYNETEQNILLSVAANSIQYGLIERVGLPVHKDNFDDPKLKADRATFVTLEINSQLRGCIGSLEAMHPLINDVAHNAFAAAFQDPRFPALNEKEFDHLDIHISILSESEPMNFSSEEDLLSQIRPGVDGLILSDNFQRGTFLPSVWESLPNAHDFLRHLKMKANLPENYWSDTLKVERYTTFSFGKHISKISMELEQNQPI